MRYPEVESRRSPEMGSRRFFFPEIEKLVGWAVGEIVELDVSHVVEAALPK